MFGNIINNDQLLKLKEARLITIEPFDEKHLKTVHYPLTPSVIYEKVGVDDKGEPCVTRKCSFDSDCVTYDFAPNEYGIVEIEEHLVVPRGIVGHFIPASGLIEAGFGLTAGRLEHPFGNHEGRRQRVRFGLKNLTDKANPLSRDFRLAYVYFVDLRGLNNIAVELSEYDVRRLVNRIRRMQIAEDSGVFYGDGS